MAEIHRVDVVRRLRRLVRVGEEVGAFQEDQGGMPGGLFPQNDASAASKAA